MVLAKRAPELRRESGLLEMTLHVALHWSLSLGRRSCFPLPLRTCWDLDNEPTCKEDCLELVFLCGHISLSPAQPGGLLNTTT